jgi:hypothetical protein
LTDFLLAENLRLAYEDHQQYASEQPAAPAGEEEASLTLEVKQKIADEVQRQLAEEQAAAAQPQQQAPPATAAAEDARPPALDPKQRVFVVSTNLAVNTGDGQACELTTGDVITRNGEPANDNTVEVSVLSAQQGGCEVGSTPRVSVEDLQEMHNSFREKLDEGMQKLAENQGKNGLPASPTPPQARPNPDGTAEPDATAASTVVAENNAAAKAETEAQPGAPN